MKKVLVALDNYDNYHLIARKGHELAKALRAQLALLHVFPDILATSPDAFSSLYSTISTVDIDIDMKLREQLKAESEKFLNKVKSELQDEKAEIFTAEGDVATAILETAASCKADIIVMGSHSRRGIEKILMGDVTKQVLKHSRLPLFIIPVR